MLINNYNIHTTYLSKQQHDNIKRTLYTSDVCHKHMHQNTR